MTYLLVVGKTTEYLVGMHDFAFKIGHCSHIFIMFSRLIAYISLALTP